MCLYIIIPHYGRDGGREVGRLIGRLYMLMRDARRKEERSKHGHTNNKVKHATQEGRYNIL